MDNLEIITTSDGSHSLLNTLLKESYHSHHGALQESLHVFIERGLKFFIAENNPASIQIFEVGFGTGLNALLTLQHAVKSKIHITYTSVDTLPLDKNIWSNLNFAGTSDDKEYFSRLHSVEWDLTQKISEEFNLLKLKSSLQTVELGSAYDIVYFDAFAPSKQPEMWEYKLLERVAFAMRSGGVFVTYCAKGQLKRDLKDLGLTVETLAGPPGKKEMIRAIKP